MYGKNESSICDIVKNKQEFGVSFFLKMYLSSLGVCATACVQRSEDKFAILVLCLYHVGPGN